MKLCTSVFTFNCIGLGDIVEIFYWVEESEVVIHIPKIRNIVKKEDIYRQKKIKKQQYHTKYIPAYLKGKNILLVNS